MSWKIGLFGTVVLFGVGELGIPGEASIYIQLGALAILATTVTKLFRELSAQRKSQADIVSKLCDRWDGWEKTRHDDHTAMTKTLTTLREHCAAQHRSKAS